MRSLIADDQAEEILAHLLQRLLQHAQLIAADHVHLGVEFQAGHAITQIQSGSRPALLRTTLFARAAAQDEWPWATSISAA